MNTHLTLTQLPQDGLISFWDFSGAPGQAQPAAAGAFPYALREGGLPVERVAEGIFGPHAARFHRDHWFYIPRGDCPALNVSGPEARVTVVAWLKREAGEWGGCQAVAGMWNEHGNRQYCLFLNLQFDGQGDQVGAHISNHGGPTPPYPYCRDAALGETRLPLGQWACVALTYDGTEAAAWLDGRLDLSPGRNPFPYPGGLHDSGPLGSDFTVGAVRRCARMEPGGPVGDTIGNPFQGLIGGLAIYNRALTAAELETLTIPR